MYARSVAAAVSFSCVYLIKVRDDHSSYYYKPHYAEDDCDYAYEISTSKNSDFTLGGLMWVVHGRTHIFHFTSSVTKGPPSTSAPLM